LQWSVLSAEWLINCVCLHFYLHQDFGVPTPARCGLRQKMRCFLAAKGIRRYLSTDDATYSLSIEQWLKDIADL
jgi:hypothetical protein